ncbi:MAG: helix-hairpin-helix domain-containing protein [Melioribacteraceae bacterium]
MRNLLKNISRKLSLTEQEIKSGTFILVILVLGFSIKFADLKISEKPIKKYNFHFYDSLSKAIELEQKSLVNEDIIVEKRVDSDLELSDFSVKKLESNKKITKNLKKNSININTASAIELIKLPGIGPKTAEKIIELRNKRNGFKKIEELLDAKGIGQKKFSAIANYLYIEK